VNAKPMSGFKNSVGSVSRQRRKEREKKKGSHNFTLLITTFFKIELIIHKKPYINGFTFSCP